jgi:hypothetical protein
VAIAASIGTGDCVGDTQGVNESRIAAAEALLRLAPETIRVQQHRLPAALLVVAMHHRATKTFRGVLVLCRGGFGEQALMLGRSLFEDMIDMHWVAAAPEQARERFDEAAWITKVRQRERADRHRESLDAAFLDAAEDNFESRLTDDERARLKSLLRSNRHGSWTRMSLSKRVELVGAQFSSDLDSKLLNLMHDAGEGLSSDFLHPSVTALYSQIDLDRLRAGAGINFHVGESSRFVPQALLLSSWAYGHALSVVYDEYELPGRELLDEAFVAMMRLYSA